MISWTPTTNGGEDEPYRYDARAGHLWLVVIDNIGTDRTKEIDADKYAVLWYVASVDLPGDPDDSRDSGILVSGKAPTFYYAKQAARRSVVRLVSQIQEGL